MSALVLPVYCAQDGARLRYVLDWLLGERLGVSYRLVTDSTEDGKGIAYGLHKNSCIFIPDEGLLQKGTREGNGLQTEHWDDPQTGTAFSFDLFSAIFFLLSRMEEWGSTALDKHFRYPHTESILHRKGWLQRPLVDEWCEALRLMLNAQLGLNISKTPFSFQPTYDIDIAWSYRHKGLVRNLGGAARDAAHRRFDLVARRFRVLRNLRPDPYDAFGRMEELHRRNGIRPLYFILAALRPAAFDKNIPPQHPAMQVLIRRLAAEGSVGMHPSYSSEDVPGRFSAEKTVLENSCGASIAISRQHFIRYWPRHTPAFLLDHGITDDYSMGYATINGFRAGTSQAFPWYNLKAECATGLRIHPFCFMDSTAHYDLGLPVEEAFAQLRDMRQRLMDCGGRLITVFHNFSLGTDEEWAGWWEAYAGFVSETVDRYCGGTAPVSQTPLSDR